ncbi:RHS repeat-associated core domain-containing protein [Ethanoligenens harbinense]|uniref:RHS repeat-associated core domain-containing protein n=1 Tax=Ethanoligenens harbinense (strain DSM 18485 / JCM 12961 / CGMCC 1.5033 / YUAN-3) TaxID=663278 RepID=E6U3E9_ETHHY|nr:RHS repeat-associated core domain-containing protein [Ethanoligenens harbinense]ADU26441.1 hypothetical protein Ethha_0876 [Ethanoligenens harbinense YUAN-3]
MTGVFLHFITGADTYDAENNRIAMAMSDSTTSYVYDTNAAMSRMLVSTDENGNKTYYIYSSGLIGSYDSSNNYAVYHYDYCGSTTALTNSSGQVPDIYTYGTYGNLTSHTGVSPTAFLFNGRDGVQTDPNGLYYMRARYYSPTLLRFVNADVKKGNIQTSESLNRCAYANGNPINDIDPFGTDTWSISLSGSAELFWYVSLSIGLVEDGNGHVAIIVTNAGTSTDTASAGLVGAGLSLGIQHTNAPDIKNIYGKSLDFGGGIKAFGGDFVIMNDGNGGYYYGEQGSLGFGAGFDFHVVNSYTTPLYTFQDPNVGQGKALK